MKAFNVEVINVLLESHAVAREFTPTGFSIFRILYIHLYTFVYVERLKQTYLSSCALSCYIKHLGASEKLGRWKFLHPFFLQLVFVNVSHAPCHYQNAWLLIDPRFLFEEI